ncbi:hypothetical protein JOC70_001373 [Clostridium pascui]|uniref:hypothetical protein n=1 Tax=Clostridium pascui TaxID=46609 RepID=UPI00195DAE25|nr:hypothetical protein [Clostridium pascui]MBM7869903.1 hypothetical protein [Clostridium pascui]
MSMSVKKIKRLNVVIALLYIWIGITGMIEGADPSSRFYYVDNIVLRIIGAALTVTSVGLLLKKELARKSFIGLMAACVLEMIITFDISIEEKAVVIITAVFAVIIYILPMIFYMLPKVKRCFQLGEWSQYESTFANYDEKQDYKHSGLGIASFVIALVSIVIFIVGVIITYNSVIAGISSEEVMQASPIVVLIGILFIGCMISSVVGLVLGIIGVFAREKKRVLAVWGIILNLIITAIFTLSTVSNIFNENILDGNYYMLFIR